MPSLYVVRIDACGAIGCYRADDRENHEPSCERGVGVLCRTERGLEVGKILARVAKEEVPSAVVRGDVVRPLSELDVSRLAAQNRQRNRAIEACQELLDQIAVPIVIVDAVYPFDGQHICFYVLGPLDPSMHAVARKIGVQFGVNVLFRPAFEGEAGGCGAGCGSNGCATGGGCSGNACATCPALKVCRKS